jgi:hypothetical protein
VLVLVVIAVFFFTVAALIIASRKIDRRQPAQKLPWRKRFNEDEGPTATDLRSVGYGWLVPFRNAMFVAFATTIIYPVLSPTFCINQKCKSKISYIEFDPSCGTITHRPPPD